MDLENQGNVNQETTVITDTTEKPKKSKKFIFIIGGIALLAVITVFVIINNQNTYKKNLKTVVVEMLDTMATAEKIHGENLVLLQKNIDKYISQEDLRTVMDLSDTEIKDTFGEPLEPLFRNMEVVENNGLYIQEGELSTVIAFTNKWHINNGDFDRMEESKREITDMLQKINNPPNKFQTEYNLALEMYADFDKYLSLAISPEGSFIDYSKDVKTYSDDFLKKYKEFEIRIPTK